LNTTFANPIDFVKTNEKFSYVKDILEIRVEWGAYGGAVRADIFIRDDLFAVLIEGEKPGWSVLAAKNGPLAKAGVVMVVKGKQVLYGQ